MLGQTTEGPFAGSRTGECKLRLLSLVPILTGAEEKMNERQLGRYVAKLSFIHFEKGRVARNFFCGGIDATTRHLFERDV